MLCHCVHLCALMNRLCGSSVRLLCWRSRTSSGDLSSLSASWHTSFHPASSFLRLPLHINLQHINTPWAHPLCVWTVNLKRRQKSTLCSPLLQWPYAEVTLESRLAIRRGNEWVLELVLELYLCFMLSVDGQSIIIMHLCTLKMLWSNDLKATVHENSPESVWVCCYR